MAKLVTGPVGKTLRQMAIPMIWGISAIILFSIVDTFYIGRLGAMELAAIGFTFPVTFLLSSVGWGLGVGSSSVISIAIGKGDKTKVKLLTTHSLILVVSITFTFAMLGIIFHDKIFSLLGASDAMIKLIRQYMIVWFAGITFLMIPMNANSAIRATGDTKTPSYIMIAAGIFNIILDPLLIFGIGPFPRLELMGGAIATVIAWLIACGLILWIIFKRDKMIIFSLRGIFSSWKQLMYIGLPSVATNILVPISGAIFTRLIAGYGESAVAAFGVGTRLESFAMIIVMALSASLMPFVGQNFGAKKFDRIKEGIKLSTIFVFLWGVGTFILYLIFAKQIGMIFNSDPEVISLIVLYLFIIPVSYGFNGAATLASSAYNALRKPYHSSFLIVLRFFVFAVPMAIIGSKLFGLVGVFGGISLANICAGIVAILMMRYCMSNL